MKQVTAKAPAKLNLGLHIVGLTDDGYHLLEMVMQSIDLYDFVQVKQERTGIQLSCDHPLVPCNQSNICVRCAQLFFDHCGLSEQGVSIHITKQIPMQAGMAGGSADGAATLVALNALFETNLTIEELCQIGKQAGADIPFCLVGGTARVQGIGEQITSMPPLPEVHIVVSKPKGGVNTQRAFQAYDQLRQPPEITLEPLLEAVQRQEILAIAEHMHNSLEQVCGLADIATIKNILLSSGAKGALMTGSGSAVFGLFLHRGKACDCERKLRERYSETFLCRPVNHGAILV